MTTVTVLVPLKIRQWRGRQGDHRVVGAILDVGGMHHRMHQQALRVDEGMALLAFDPLAAVEAGRIDPPPPFSALLTLWLSIGAAVGLVSRPA